MRNISKVFKQEKEKGSRNTSNVTTTATPENVPLFPDGVRVWIDPPDAAIDVCFVHGLTGDRDATWTASGHSEPWPSSLLPGKLPNARLLTYGYDAYIVRKVVASINTLSDHATNLLKDLTDDRESCNASSRPIIFVAHSLGGLICKEAILESRNNPEPHLRKVFQSVVGIIFMGTPHTGSWTADWANIPARALGALKSTNRTLLEVLKTDSQLLQSIQSRFLSTVRELRENKRIFEIACFFEELPLGVLDRVVVTKTSATFEGYPLASIHANHSNMVKFESAEDNGFRRLSGYLIRWAKLPPSDQNHVTLPHYEDCLRSLSFPEMDDRFKDIDHATEGTCEWLLEHAEYKKWATCNRSLLWIKGKPGSGKSTLLQHALSNARKHIGNGPLILSFFFHGRGVELQKTPLGLFRSLLHQLLRHAPDTLSDLVTIFEDQCTNKGKPNTDWQWHVRELLDFLKSSITTILANRSVWLFVDALDECGKKNATDLVRDFKTLLQESPSTNSQFRICFACRHYPILDLGFGFEICLDDQNKEDIFTYVQNQLSTHMTSRIPVTIPETIMRRASGVFLWTRLVLERVIDLARDGIGWKEIEAEINIIPESLNDVYQDIVTGMNNQSSLKLIQWICFAARPLSLVELQWAMVIDHKCPDRSLQEYESETVDDETMRRQIKTLSCGLAEITRSSHDGIRSNEVVQFIHQSVKDFFVDKGLLTLDGVSKSVESAIGNAHYQLSRTCIRYFTMKEAGQLSPYNQDYRISKFPFLQYAAGSWIWHEKQIGEGTSSQEDLLDYFAWPSARPVKLWIQLFYSTNGSSFRPHPEKTQLIHVASYYQLIRPLQMIMVMSDKIGIDIDLEDELMRTPLSYAAEQGHQTAVQLLLNTGKVQVNSKDKYGYTPLLRAAGNGHQAVVQLLLNTGKVKVNPMNKYGYTPLAHAAEQGHEAVVKLLLNTGKVKVNPMNKYGYTPLAHAAEQGHEAVVKLLLNTGKVEVNSKSKYDYTPLAHAAEQGHEAVVKLLLNTGKVKVDSKNKYRSTPLAMAARNGHQAIVQLLLDTGKVEVDLKDKFGITPLSRAAFNGHQAIVQLLLDTGKVEVDLKDNFGDTALSRAAFNGHQAVVQLLQDHHTAL